MGKKDMRDYYKGYCLPKGINICFVMKELKKETPKFYVLRSIYDDPDTQKTDIMSGYMLKGSYLHGYFHSPVYAMRRADDEDVPCNILTRSNISDNILYELDKLTDR